MTTMTTMTKLDQDRDHDIDPKFGPNCDQVRDHNLELIIMYYVGLHHQIGATPFQNKTYWFSWQSNEQVILNFYDFK